MWLTKNWENKYWSTTEECSVKEWRSNILNAIFSSGLYLSNSGRQKTTCIEVKNMGCGGGGMGENHYEFIHKENGFTFSFPCQ